MIVAVALLAGCSTTPALQGPTPEMIAAADNERCIGYGFKPGTDAYADCRLRIEEARQANYRAAAAVPMPSFQSAPLAPYQIPTNRPVNCTSVGAGAVVSTSCN